MDRRCRSAADAGARHWGIARLILLNGPPSVGKTSLARRFAADHPLTLVLDVDGLRTHLGQWDRHEKSRVLARSLAIALVDTHLAAGHDVVVPQYVGRPPFVDALQAAAARHDASFVHVVLEARRAVVVERFRARRAGLAASAVAHPEADVPDDAIDDVVADAARRLATIATRPGVRVLPAAGDLAGTYAALLDALRSAGRCT